MLLRRSLLGDPVRVSKVVQYLNWLSNNVIGTEAKPALPAKPVVTADVVRASCLCVVGTAEYRSSNVRDGYMGLSY